MKSEDLQMCKISAFLWDFFHPSHNHWKVMTLSLSLFHSLYSSTYSIAPAAYSPRLRLPPSHNPSLVSYTYFFLSLFLSVAGSSSNLSVQIQLPSLPETHTSLPETHTHTHTSLEGKQIIPGQGNCFVWFTLVCLFFPPSLTPSLPPTDGVF